jgi:hypothetical protein
MIKSISSVFENSIIADSTLGHAFNVGPYIEPAGNMVFARNSFANLTGQGDYSVGDAASMQTVAHSGGWVVGQAGRPAADYNFTENTDPKLSDPVIKEWDNNLFFGVEGHSLDQLKPYGWDMHAVEADPLFQRLSGTNTWNRTCADYALAADSPAWALGFRRIAIEEIGLRPNFPWPHWPSEIGRINAVHEKVQAERYSRMRGLWRMGSTGLAPGFGWGAGTGAGWARYENVDAICSPRCVVSLRMSTVGNTTVRVAVGSPDDHAVVASGTLFAAAPAAKDMGIFNLTVTKEPIIVQCVNIFLLLQGEGLIDWFRFLPVN